MRHPTSLLPLLLLAGCAHRPLAPDAAARMRHPAFVVRVSPGGEGMEGVVRYELAERLRAGLFQSLPRKAPWTGRVDPLAVMNALQLLLVQDESTRPLDYANLRPLGADGVVELEVRRWGLRRDAKAGDAVYVEVEGRVFLLDGADLWRGTVAASLPAPGGLSDAQRRALLAEAFAEAGKRTAARLSPEAAAAQVPPPGP
ncbi:MAG: hypothetical protein FJ086_20520 [Deltaproteobacteria bacterium]|nr:hypothetical protein [Deltaproteobacteria bacterium]